MRPDVKLKVDINQAKIKKKFDATNQKVIRILKSEIVKDTEPMVPFRDDGLRCSVTQSLVNNEPKIMYAIVYARFLYYGKVMVGKISRKVRANKGEEKETINRDLTYSQGGSFWFENSKKKNLDKWLKIVKKLYK